MADALGPSVARGVILDVVARGSVDDLAGGLVAFLFIVNKDEDRSLAH
jgi:hypothetical protein